VQGLASSRSTDEAAEREELLNREVAQLRSEVAGALAAVKGADADGGADPALSGLLAHVSDALEELRNSVRCALHQGACCHSKWHESRVPVRCSVCLGTQPYLDSTPAHHLALAMLMEVGIRH
jgi:hypothetical protein